MTLFVVKGDLEALIHHVTVSIHLCLFSLTLNKLTPKLPCLSSVYWAMMKQHHKTGIDPRLTRDEY